MAKRTTKPPTPPEQTVQVKGIKLDVRVDTPSYYVNYMGIAHTVFDFTLSAARIPSQLTEEQVAIVKKGEPLTLEPILQLIVPPILIDGLINALTDQKKRYEETIAKVKEHEHQQQHTGKNISVH